MNTCISAVQHLRPLRGGAQSHLLKASNGACYVTKFQNNPQHIRVLANEMLATNLGLALGLPLPRVEVIEVSDWLIEHTEGLRIDLGGSKIPCQSGKQLGSLYVGSESPAMTLDYLPRELLQRVVNVGDFARVLVLDKWTCNSDGRQAIFWRKTPRSQRYTATFIDQGYCFNAGDWTFPDSPLRGVYANNCVYESATGWESFEPALTRAEEMASDAIWRCAAEIPEEWYEGDRDGLNRLVEALHYRRTAIRGLIGNFRESIRNPFPNWGDSPPSVDLSTVRRDEVVEIRQDRNLMELYIIAGPNGVGKTTFARTFLPKYADCKNFINADLIAQGMSPFSPEAAAVRAGRLMLSEIRFFAQRRATFAFETTLSGRSYLRLIRQLKKQGYKVHFFFLGVKNVDVALSRVRERVLKGGHNVPEAVVRRRFGRSISNFFAEYES